MPNVYYPFTKRNKQGEVMWEWRNLTCPNCGGPFATRNPEKVYCSRKCKHNAIMKRKRNVEKVQKEANRDSED